MGGEAGRLSRAGSYVLGLMSEAERRRAERDLEIDPAFRDAVLQVAERMKLLDFVPQKDAAPDWRLIAERIAAMPQMRGTGGMPGMSTVIDWPLRKVTTVSRGLHAVPSRRAAIFAITLILACAVGYVAGIMTGGLW